MIVILSRVTILLATTLAAITVMRNSSAAMRHLVCVIALAGSLLIPLAGVTPAPSIMIHVPVTAVTGAATAFSLPFVSVSRAVIAVWMVGILALLIRTAFGYRAVSRIACAAVDDGIFESDITVPVACGLLHPRILLPRGASLWPKERLSAVIRHEQAHIRRGDLWTSLIGQMACALWWFHPLVWMVDRKMRDERELACDDAVLNGGFAPSAYADALLAAAQQFTSNNLMTGCPMFTIKTLKSRIARVLDRTLPRATSIRSLTRTGFICAAVVTLVGLVNPVRGQDERIYKVGGDVSSPQLLRKVDPLYTPSAEQAQIEGNVILSVVIGTDGMARDCKVIKSLEPGLDSNAIAALQQWRFEPARKFGEAVSVRAQIEVKFKLM